MRTRMLYGLCVLFLLARVAFAQDKMIIIFKDGKTQSIDVETIQKIEYQTAPAGAKTYTWAFQRIGDCPGNDINNTRGSTPVSSLCNEKAVGLTAVCWEGGCTYKNVAADRCTGGKNPGQLYKCTDVSDVSSAVPFTQEKILLLGHVEVVKGTNLALGKTATQSSISYGGDPGRAIDGNTNGNFNSGSVSHTAQQNQAWWQVDLGNVYRISNIRIWNRTDCCAERLSKFYVIVSETPFASSGLNATIRQSGVWNSYIDGNAVIPYNIPVNSSGRYVRIQLSGTNVLNLAEVEVVSGGKSGISQQGIVDGSLFPSGTQWSVGAIINGIKISPHHAPWIFQENGMIEAPGYWKGTWTPTPEGYRATIVHQGVSDTFLVKFSADKMEFTAFKDGIPYRYGMRKK